MSDTFASLTNIQWDSPTYGIAYPTSPDKLIVVFHKQAIQNHKKSADAGRPIYEEFDYVRIQHPGERDYVDRKVTQQDAHRWPAQWMAYTQQKGQAVIGTPIDLLFPKHPGIAANIRSAGFHTVEQLAEASAHGMSNLGMSAQDYVNAAQRYLEVAQRGVAHHQMQQELDQRDQEIRLNKQEIADLKNDITGLKRQLDRLMNTQVAQAHQSQQSVQVQVQGPDLGLPPPPIGFPELPELPADKPKRNRAKI